MIWRKCAETASQDCLAIASESGARGAAPADRMPVPPGTHDPERLHLEAEAPGPVRHREHVARIDLPGSQAGVFLRIDGGAVSCTARMRVATHLVSESTAKTHISRIYGKLGVANRAQAIMRGVRTGLLADT